MFDEVARSRQFALAFTVGAVVIAAVSGWIFWSMHEAEPIVAGPGVTAQHMLGEYQPNIKGGDGDTPVFELIGGKEGPTLMVLGGTHPQEIAGMLAAIILVENAKVTQGKLIVLPQANRSGFTYTEPMEASYHSFEIERPDGSLQMYGRVRSIAPSAFFACRGSRIVKAIPSAASASSDLVPRQTLRSPLRLFHHMPLFGPPDSQPRASMKSLAFFASSR